MDFKPTAVKTRVKPKQKQKHKGKGNMLSYGKLMEKRGRKFFFYCKGVQGEQKPVMSDE